MHLYLAVCAKGDKKNVLENPDKVPDDAVTSNTPKDPSNPPSDVKDKGFKTPVKTNNNKSPRISIKLNKVCNYVLSATTSTLTHHTQLKMIRPSFLSLSHQIFNFAHANPPPTEIFEVL